MILVKSRKPLKTILISLLKPYICKSNIFVVDNATVRSQNIAGVLAMMNVPKYSFENWELFMDTCKSSLKIIVLKNIIFFKE